jgi:hypothetical protein
MGEDIKKKTREKKARKIYIERKGTKNERTKWKERGCKEKGNKDRWKRNEN